tara:strand:- start:10130 stop:11182 length:1053 start_codon:yes stop_codon:yes gene_type:complete
VVIEKNTNPKINQINFNEIQFGEIFSDHMFVCDYKNNKWNTPKIVPYQDLLISPSANGLHYGQAVFEGMKAYKDAKNKIWLFRPKENWARINKSCERLEISLIPENIFIDGIKTLVSIDSKWVQPGKGNSLYIRPFVFANQNCIQASPSKEFKFLIICTPAKSYYNEEQDFNVLIAEKYSRAASGGVGYAKAAGNYAASFYPTKLAQNKGFDQIIWTDANSHQYIEEAGTMNIFVRINNSLITSPTNDRILDGITRKSIIQIAKDKGINVEIRPIKVKELIDSFNDGTLKELFGAGTAVVVCPITSFGYKEKKYKLPFIKESYANILKDALTSIQYNSTKDPHNWRVSVE